MITFSAQQRDNTKAIELRQHITQVALAENEKLKQRLSDYQASGSHDIEDAKALSREIIAMSDRVLQIEGWEDSLFLRNVMKPLQEAKANAEAFIEEHDDSIGHTHEDMARKIQSDEQMVYMTLYQTGASHHLDWLTQLNTIEKTLLGRPVYFDEHAARGMIRSKIDRSADAYIMLHLNSALIDSIKNEQENTDNNGFEFITLQPSMLTTEHIVELVYKDQRYFYMQGELIKK